MSDKAGTVHGVRLSHRTFTGSVIVDEDNTLFGLVDLSGGDLVTYQGSDIIELRDCFIQAVDDYIETCAELYIENLSKHCS